MKVDVHWNANIAKDLTTEVMGNLAVKGRQRLTTVTCPVHHSTHRVRWESRGEKINVVAENACCEELEKTLYAAAQRALR